MKILGATLIASIVPLSGTCFGELQAQLFEGRADGPLAPPRPADSVRRVQEQRQPRAGLAPVAADRALRHVERVGDLLLGESGEEA